LSGVPASQKGRLQTLGSRKYAALDRFFRYATSVDIYSIESSHFDARSPAAPSSLTSTRRRHPSLAGRALPRITREHVRCPPDTMRTFLLVLTDRDCGLGEVSRLTHSDADLKSGTLADSGNEVWQIATGSDRKRSCSILRLYRMRIVGCRLPRPPTPSPTKIGCMIQDYHADHEFEWLRREAGVLRLTVPAISQDSMIFDTPLP